MCAPVVEGIGKGMIGMDYRIGVMCVHAAKRNASSHFAECFMEMSGAPRLTI